MSRSESPESEPDAQEAAPLIDAPPTAINLDQADAVAEADFHLAYGLYDQAADIVKKTLALAPYRRDLQLKLLEVYFMWGNKDAFLRAVHRLRTDLKQGDDSDWNKVVIMGRQIAPDEPLFAEATAGKGTVHIDLGFDAPDFDTKDIEGLPTDVGLDSESGKTSLVGDRDLDDLTAALHGAETIEQPRAKVFRRDVFAGDTSMDLDDSTGTEDSPLDPATMTEVGTKLDLARAYIDMGDAEGARSILEEVLDEGDSNQRREAERALRSLAG